VSHVQIFNRLDCCQARLGRFQIWIGRSPGDYNSSTSIQCGFQGAAGGAQWRLLSTGQDCQPSSFWFGADVVGESYWASGVRPTIAQCISHCQSNGYEFAIVAQDGDCKCAPGEGGCTDTCEYATDGECDDGGPGAERMSCAYGSDCTDCGLRQPGCSSFTSASGWKIYKAPPQTNFVNEAPPTVGPFTYDCNQIVGTYITIVLPGPSRTLNLAEVRIFSTYESPSPPPP
jgi:hypothetical protein